MNDDDLTTGARQIGYTSEILSKVDLTADKAAEQLAQRIPDPLGLQDVPLLVNDEQLELLVQA